MKFDKNYDYRNDFKNGQGKTYYEYEAGKNATKLATAQPVARASWPVGLAEKVKGMEFFNLGR